MNCTLIAMYFVGIIYAVASSQVLQLLPFPAAAVPTPPSPVTGTSLPGVYLTLLDWSSGLMSTSNRTGQGGNGEQEVFFYFLSQPQKVWDSLPFKIYERHAKR
uniref:Uncharacterized protein n=1 Tax=Anopheles culicifacies TaxID=139723 RepID=A0A182M0C3_9DIPT